MELISYLSFNGNCEEALNFYKDALGGEIVSTMRYGDTPMPADEATKNKIMHSVFKFGNNTFMCADSMNPLTAFTGNSMSLSLGFATVQETEDTFAKISAGGVITMPMQDTFWGARFGMCTDKFGIHWMFNCDKK